MHRQDESPTHVNHVTRVRPLRRCPVRLSGIVHTPKASPPTSSSPRHGWRERTDLRLVCPFTSSPSQFTHAPHNLFPSSPSPADTIFAGSHSLRWSREERVPSGLRCRLSRSKRWPGLESDMASSTGGEHIVFTDSPVAPGVPIVYRPPEERAANPDRLNLDRRHLSVCPILEGEERLRLLNLQHNSIARLQHLGSLRRLVFLDLYDNLLQEISSLEGLVSLRVLMLGKNRCGLNCHSPSKNHFTPPVISCSLHPTEFNGYPVSRL